MHARASAVWLDAYPHAPQSRLTAAGSRLQPTCSDTDQYNVRTRLVVAHTKKTSQALKCDYLTSTLHCKARRSSSA